MQDHSLAAPSGWMQPENPEPQANKGRWCPRRSLGSASLCTGLPGTQLSSQPLGYSPSATGLSESRCSLHPSPRTFPSGGAPAPLPALLGPHLLRHRDALPIDEGEDFVVVHDRVHALDPQRVHGAVEKDPLLVRLLILAGGRWSGSQTFFPQIPPPPRPTHSSPQGCEHVPPGTSALPRHLAPKCGLPSPRPSPHPPPRLRHLPCPPHGPLGTCACCPHDAGQDAIRPLVSVEVIFPIQLP